MTLGDSFTISIGGVPWEWMWPTRLGRLLQEHTERDVEVINLGVPAVGPWFARRMWQVEGERLDPDLVILGCFVGNDFENEQRKREGEDLNATLARHSYVVRLVRTSWLLHAAVVRSGRDRKMGISERRPRDSGGYPLEGYRERFMTRRMSLTRETLLKIEARRSSICERSRLDGLAEVSEAVASVLSSLHASVTETGAAFLVLLIPDRVQVNEKDRLDVLARRRMQDAEVDWTAPQRRLAAFFEDEGIPYLDLLLVLRAKAKTLALYTLGNTHWSPAGN